MFRSLAATQHLTAHLLFVGLRGYSHFLRASIHPLARKKRGVSSEHAWIVLQTIFISFLDFLFGQTYGIFHNIFNFFKWRLPILPFSVEEFSQIFENREGRPGGRPPCKGYCYSINSDIFSIFDVATTQIDCMHPLWIKTILANGGNMRWRMVLCSLTWCFLNLFSLTWYFTNT